jgi:hypothetical protein
MTNVFVVISAAIPKEEKLNSLAIKVSSVCTRSSKAEEIAKIIKTTHPSEEMVYGINCKIITSVIDVPITGDLDKDQELVYVIITAAIPTKIGSHPIQLNVHSVHTSQNSVEQTFKKIQSKDSIIVNGINCGQHASIIPIKLNKS